MTLTGIRGLVGLLAPLLVCHGSSNPNAESSATTTETSTSTSTTDTTTTVGTTEDTDTTDATTSMTDTSPTTSMGTTQTTATTSMTTSTTMPDPECGDGNVDPGEECDDGAGNGDGMACTAECESATDCGDGHAYLVENGGTEECDDGNGDDTDECIAGCIAATCGDGFVWADVEACDDANDIDVDRCSNNCAKVRRFVFATFAADESNLFNGSLGGLSGADAKCQARADNANALEILKGHKYRAWLSDASVGPANRFSAASEPFTGDYVVAQASKDDPGWALLAIGTGWTGLASAMHSNPITHDEYGGTSPYSSVWTNTKADGTPGGGDNIDRHCNDWTSSNNFSVYGNLGATTDKSATWTAKAATVCGSVARLYCVEDL